MYCKIFISKHEVDALSLHSNVANYLFEKHSILKNSPTLFEFEILRNKEFDQQKQTIFPDGFLFFPLFIEISGSDDNLTFNMDCVAEVLKYQWSNNYSAIASCNFEHLLPENGGYKSTRIPWPVEY